MISEQQYSLPPVSTHPLHFPSLSQPQQINNVSLSQYCILTVIKLICEHAWKSPQKSRHASVIAFTLAYSKHPSSFFASSHPSCSVLYMLFSTPCLIFFHHPSVFEICSSILPILLVLQLPLCPPLLSAAVKIERLVEQQQTDEKCLLCSEGDFNVFVCFSACVWVLECNWSPWGGKVGLRVIEEVAMGTQAPPYLRFVSGHLKPQHACILFLSRISLVLSNAALKDDMVWVCDSKTQTAWNSL